MPGGQAVGVLSVHLAGFCLPEAGKTAEVPTVPEIYLRSFNLPHPKSGCAPRSPRALQLFPLFLSSGRAQALLLPGAPPGVPSPLSTALGKAFPSPCLPQAGQFQPPLGPTAHSTVTLCSQLFQFRGDLAGANPSESLGSWPLHAPRFEAVTILGAPLLGRQSQRGCEWWRPDTRLWPLASEPQDKACAPVSPHARSAPAGRDPST